MSGRSTATATPAGARPRSGLSAAHPGDGAHESVHPGHGALPRLPVSDERQQPPGRTGSSAPPPMPGLPAEALLEFASRAGRPPARLKAFCRRNRLEAEEGWYEKAVAALGR